MERHRSLIACVITAYSVIANIYARVVAVPEFWSGWRGSAALRMLKQYFIRAKKYKLPKNTIFRRDFFGAIKIVIYTQGLATGAGVVCVLCESLSLDRLLIS